jgi:hypothetical protein
MNTNYTLVKSNSKYEKCWIKYIKVLDRCIDFIPVGTVGSPVGIDNDRLEICYEIFKKNYQECISYNSLYFNKIIK